jgi:hypothetical protein
MTDDRKLLRRRDLLRGATLGGSGLLLSGCDAMNENATFRSALRVAEKLNQVTHRTLADRATLAPEFALSDISPVFKTNGDVDGVFGASSKQFCGLAVAY